MISHLPLFMTFGKLNMGMDIKQSIYLYNCFMCSYDYHLFLLRLFMTLGIMLTLYFSLLVTPFFI